MKYILIQPDGMADEPLESLGNKTPLEVAHSPAMDELASRGYFGFVHTIPEGFPPGSDIGNLALIGHNPSQVFTGRAPLEAAAQGIETEPEDVIFRANLVTIENGIMVDFTAGHITDEEAAQLMQFLNIEIPKNIQEVRINFVPGVSYRNLVIWHNGPTPTKAEPPHNLTDGPVEGFSAQPQPAVELMLLINKLLKDHPVNKARIAAGKRPATDLWLWGEGRTPTLNTIDKMYNFKSATMITAVDLLRGIAKLSGVTVRDVPGATGFIDTDYEAKCQKALERIELDDFVFVHIEAPDESAHMGRSDYKIKSIEDIDSLIVGPLLAYAKRRDDVTIICLPDHPTLIRTKTHSNSPVPCAVVYPDQMAVSQVTPRDFLDAPAQPDFRLLDGWELLNSTIARSWDTHPDKS